MHVHALMRDRRQWDLVIGMLADDLLKAPVFDRGEVHAQKIEDPRMHTKELDHVVLRLDVPDGPEDLQRIVRPNLPWAEDHFQERVSRRPLNPPPSHEWWPFNQKGNEAHIKAGQFSHTYPERFWPKRAGQGNPLPTDPNLGIRFAYGDLQDMVALLRRNPRTRQAYLPVWFPEDLAAAKLHERVPCTLGYHFLQNQRDSLDCTYFIRSCDFVRFFFDDVYMAARLLQWTAQQTILGVGDLTVHIVNLHCFVGDDHWLKKWGVDEYDEEDFDEVLGGMTG